jgi:hypothetical protein
LAGRQRSFARGIREFRFHRSWRVSNVRTLAG